MYRQLHFSISSLLVFIAVVGYFLNANLARDSGANDPCVSVSLNGSEIDTHYGWPFAFLTMHDPNILDPNMLSESERIYSFTPLPLLANVFAFVATPIVSIVGLHFVFAVLSRIRLRRRLRRR